MVASVGSFLPGGYGIYGMSNIWKWCVDDRVILQATLNAEPRKARNEAISCTAWRFLRAPASGYLLQMQTDNQSILMSFIEFPIHLHLIIESYSCWSCLVENYR